MADSSRLTANVVTSATDASGSQVISIVQSNNVESSSATANVTTGGAGSAGEPGTSGVLTKLTVGKTGSGADYECDGIDDHIQIQAAIDQAVTAGNIAAVEVIGYGYDFIYQLGAAVVLKAREINNGLVMIDMLGTNTVCKLKDGYSGDGFITYNFYNDIETNFNSYSAVGNGLMQGFTIEGNSINQVRKTLIYSNQAAFPAFGVVGKLYVAQDQDSGFGVGYLWTGAAYATTGIKNSGKAWRAYANHLVKIYGYNYVLRDMHIRDADEFALYSEQTNTDTNIFNNYASMESTLDRIKIVGWNLGGIHWFGPHDSRWSDVKLHTNEYASTGSGNTALYNIYVSQGANNNGGGLVWDDVHPWGPTASDGTNVILRNTNVYGNAYIEGSSNQGLYATGCTLDLDLKITNNGATNVRLNNCFDTSLRLNNVYQYTATATLVKLEGSLTNSEIAVHTINTNNVGSGAKVFDVTSLTSDLNVNLYARIPYNANLSAGVTASSLGASSGIMITKAGSTAALTTSIRKLPNGNDQVKNPRYFGAVGDDTTDDTAAIQAAVTAAGEGGITELPPGKYRTLSPIYLPRGAQLRGTQGLRWRYVITPNVYIKPRSTFSGLAAIIMQDKEQGGYATEQGGQRIERLNVDMSALTTGTADGILGSGLIRDVRISEVSVSYARGKGIRTVGYTRVDTVTYYPRGWQLDHCVADTGFDNGFGFNLMTDMSMNDCLAVGNLANGFSFSGPGENLVVNTRAVFNKNNGFLVTGSQFGTTSFVNISTDRNEYNGMLINVSGATAAKYPINITNPNFRRDGRNGNSGGGGYAGLSVVSATSPVIVDNISVVQGVDDGGSGTSSPDNGVYASGSDLTITSGHIWGNATAANDGGSNTNFILGPAVQLATGAVGGAKTTVKAAGTETSGYVYTAQGAGKTPLWAAPAAGADATTGSKGILQLANDLGGTAALPTVIATHLASALPVNQGGTGITAFGTGIATFLGTPSSANLATAITDETGSGALVFGTSPTIATPVLNGTPTGTGVASAATASVLALRDSNANLFASNMIINYNTTATAGGTTTLTNASGGVRFYTGTLNQTVVMPVTSTLTLGTQWLLVNRSTGSITIQSSGTNTIVVLAPGTAVRITCILTSGTSAASWDALYFASNVASGKALTANNSLILAGTDATTMTFPTTSATIARTDAAQVFTGIQTFTSPSITTPTGIVKGDVGLGNVDNTSDINKPISTLQQAGIDFGAARRFYVYEDFINASNTSQLLYTGSGTTGIITAPDASSIGVVSLNTSTGATNREGIWSNGVTAIYFDTTAIWSHEDKLQLSALSDGTDTYQIFSGFLDSATGESTDGAYFSYTHSLNSGKFELVTAQGGTRTRTDSTITVAATTWYKLRVQVLSVSGTLTARFFINGTQVGGDITANLPNATSKVFGYGTHIIKSVGTTNRFISIDYKEVVGTFAAGR